MHRIIYDPALCLFAEQREITHRDAVWANNPRGDAPKNNPDNAWVDWLTQRKPWHTMNLGEDQHRWLLSSGSMAFQRVRQLVTSHDKWQGVKVTRAEGRRLARGLSIRQSAGSHTQELTGFVNRRPWHSRAYGMAYRFPFMVAKPRLCGQLRVPVS